MSITTYPGLIMQYNNTFPVHLADIKTVVEGLPQDQQDVLTRTAARIRAFAAAQRSTIQTMEIAVEGSFAGQTVEPVRCAGCYALVRGTRYHHRCS